MYPYRRHAYLYPPIWEEMATYPSSKRSPPLPTYAGIDGHLPTSTYQRETRLSFTYLGSDGYLFMSEEMATETWLSLPTYKGGGGHSSF